MIFYPTESFKKQQKLFIDKTFDLLYHSNRKKVDLDIVRKMIAKLPVLSVNSLLSL